MARDKTQNSKLTSSPDIFSKTASLSDARSKFDALTSESTKCPLDKSLRRQFKPRRLLRRTRSPGDIALDKLEFEIVASVITASSKIEPDRRDPLMVLFENFDLAKQASVKSSPSNFEFSIMHPANVAPRIVQSIRADLWMFDERKLASESVHSQKSVS